MVKNRITHFFSKSFKLYPILIYCIFAFSCSSTLNYSIKKKRRYFQKNIALILEEANLNATIGIKIVSLENSKTLYELNSKRLLIPASNMKLLTFASALESLGPEYFPGVFSSGIIQEILPKIKQKMPQLRTYKRHINIAKGFNSIS